MGVRTCIDRRASHALTKWSENRAQPSELFPYWPKICARIGRLELAANGLEAKVLTKVKMINCRVPVESIRKSSHSVLKQLFL